MLFRSFCYDRGLMDRYGMLAYRSDVPDRLGQVFEASDVPGSVLLEMTPNARLTEADALELQIRQFMSGRLPVRLAERFAAVQQSVRSRIETADRVAVFSQGYRFAQGHGRKAQESSKMVECSVQQIFRVPYSSL